MVAEREDIHWARGVGNGRIDLSLEGRPAPGGEGRVWGEGREWRGDVGLYTGKIRFPPPPPPLFAAPFARHPCVQSAERFIAF